METEQRYPLTANEILLISSITAIMGQPPIYVKPKEKSILIYWHSSITCDIATATIFINRAYDSGDANWKSILIHAIAGEHGFKVRI